MDARTLAEAMGWSLSLDRYEALCPAFNRALRQANCTTVVRVAMFCSQIGHESGGLQWMQEIWGPTAAQRGYEGRVDLGNTQPGDGFRFRGHGPIQITGRYNHSKVSEWAFANGYVPFPSYFVDRPDELAGNEYGFLGAVWYWTVARNMNAYADSGDVTGATRAVNGGLNGYQDRLNRWNRCLALGEALLPSGESMTDSANLSLDQLAGIGFKGWEFLGVSRFDPTRFNTLVEAVADIRDALLKPEASVANPDVAFKITEFIRFIDASTFRTEQALETLTELVGEISVRLRAVENRLES